ncbi:MAG: hypothetical protein K6A65_09625, partial [Succinivibrionaceae bacterium]|nr:hypothetical protein [Succinivibrionaceae bacterium]
MNNKKMPALTPLAAAVLALLAANPALAYEVRTVNSPNGNAIFELRYFDTTDGTYDPHPGDGHSGISTYDLSSQYRDEIERAAAFWAEVLGDSAQNSTPAPFNIGAFEEENNASCGSTPNDDEEVGNIHTGLMAALQLGKAMENPAIVNIGIIDSPGANDYPSTLSRDNEIWSTMVHEMGHALGVLSFASIYGSRTEAKEVQMWSVFDNHLYDRFGTALGEVGKIEYLSASDTLSDPDADTFYIGDTGSEGLVYFHGTQVDEVTGGAGIPIEGFEFTTLDLSHLELERSMMSHQGYRNISIFMEPELALLQDLGYEFDRSRFFGRTIFKDDQIVENSVGFSSSATLGIGLHVYGKRANVTQLANISASGEGANGIRIDGSASTLTVPAGVTVSANGSHGYGVLVAYGKDHVLNLAGTVEATGEGGYGIRLDFGDNLCSNQIEYRGSYIRTLSGSKTKYYGNVAISGTDGSGYELNLDGALVKDLNISGTVSGSAAAIYASSNAYVDTINLLTGAAIEGDIVSDWDPESDLLSNDAPTDLYTLLNTGYGVNADGTSTGAADSAFNSTINGSIRGSKSILMRHHGGRLTVTGSVETFDLTNSATLSLTGSGATVQGTFTNEAGATLELGFSPSGATSSVTIASGGAASLAGTLALRTAQGFYRDGSSISVNAVSGGTITGDFGQVSILDSSPTLDFAVSGSKKYSPTITVERPEDAYSRHGRNASEASVGHALYHISSEATGDMQSLISAVDFSGSSAAVAQALSALAPTAYDFSGLAAFRDLSVVSSAITTHQ